MYNVNLHPNNAVFPSLSEDALVRLSQVHQEYYSALYNRYSPLIRKYFLHRVPDQETADDLTQDTFSLAFEKISSFIIRGGKYHSYLFRIAHNVLVSFYRQRHLDVRLDEKVVELSVVGKKREFPVLDSDIEYIVKNLSPVDRIIFLMKYRDSASIREISVKVKKSENAVKLHLSRARKMLSKKIINKQNLG
ncbi:MAG: sigma-70 family RNA polymerase sigma factor [Candidatus Magasanikbacteria bacterium]|nr:sigma-70 family RNA polymerase sigma factor [Candidatus Magasanikbacteria bacterium]